MLTTRSLSPHLLTAVALAATAALVAAPLVLAAPGGASTDKMRICHRTNSLTNPYVSIEVAQSSVDGSGGKGDHYLNHTGSVWTPASTKAQGWGDIIPPIPGVHGGLNWTPQGEAIWSAACAPRNEVDTDGDLVPDLVDTDDDGDRTPDAVDTDDDADGTPDSTDPDQSTTTDSDGDTVPDALDGDDDGDGIDDGFDPDTPEPITPPVDVPSDIDKDGTPDASDPDQDGDGISNVQDPDQDGDGNPDVSDGDDDNDRIPDGEDGGSPEVAPADVTDTDGDGTPDASDRDDDGDGIRDVRDADADGNGEPETRPQPIDTDVVLAGAITAGDEVVLVRSVPLTVAGAQAAVRVTCRAGGESVAVRSALAGDSRAGRSLCDVTRGKNGRVSLTVRGAEPVVVSVILIAPAVGDYLAETETATYSVSPA